jgi:uncharacterized protein YnzC (UPF0291/DUF896 family)
MTREEWDAQQNSLKKEYKYMPTSEKGVVEKVEVTNEDGEPLTPEQIRQEWNKFNGWMRQNKYLNMKELDVNNYGNNLFDKWQKLTNSPLTRDSMTQVRQQMLGSIDETAKALLNPNGKVRMPDSSGKLVYGEEARPVADRLGWAIKKNELSKNPNYVGSIMSSFRFPDYETKETIEGDINKAKTMAELKSMPVKSSETKKINQ